MRGVLLWTRRDIWSRRTCWKDAPSQSWQRPTTFIAAGSTSSWPATGPVATEPWSPAPGHRAPAPTRPPRRWCGQSCPCASSCSRRDTTAARRRSPTTSPRSSTRFPRSRRSGASCAVRGSSIPQPQKRPRSSLIRFEAQLPNEMWQADITHWSLAGGQDVEVLNMIDDHSRLFLASLALPTFKAADVAGAFRSAVALHGAPASLALRQRRRVHRETARGQGALAARDGAAGGIRQTRGPTTLRPAARWSACTRR